MLTVLMFVSVKTDGLGKV